MRRTGKFRAREQYQDLFGAGTYERKGDLVIAFERLDLTVINRLQASKDAIMLRYFEPEYEWADGKLVFLSERNPFLPVWFIRDLSHHNMGLIHSTFVSFAKECADEGKDHMRFYDTRRDAEIVLSSAIKEIENKTINEIANG